MPPEGVWYPVGHPIPLNHEAGTMTTKLDRPLKREIVVDEKPYTLTIDAAGLKLVEKGRRNGQEVSWKQILSTAPAAQ
jgi:hypothetical protein